MEEGASSAKHKTLCWSHSYRRRRPNSLTGWGFMEGEPKAAASFGRKETPPARLSSLDLQFFVQPLKNKLQERKEWGKNKGIMDNFLM